jgi:hypothetical protein
MRLEQNSVISCHHVFLIHVCTFPWRYALARSIERYFPKNYYCLKWRQTMHKNSFVNTVDSPFICLYPVHYKKNVAVAIFELTILMNMKIEFTWRN